jgi:iron complex transport system substrate-binding protein
MRALALVIALALAGATHARVAVIDDEGRTVELVQPERRIVSLAPHLTEQLFAIGAGDLIVGTTDFADFPEAAKGLPRVARAHSVDLERVSAARPDVHLQPSPAPQRKHRMHHLLIAAPIWFFLADLFRLAA